MNTINTENAYEYFSSCLENENIKLVKAIKLYEAARTEYEKTRWFKFFKTPFEKTDMGNKGWMGSSCWQEWIIESRILRVKQHLAKCLYHIKIEHPEICWDFEYSDVVNFYTWAEENKVPY